MKTGSACGKYVVVTIQPTIELGSETEQQDPCTKRHLRKNDTFSDVFDFIRIFRCFYDFFQSEKITQKMKISNQKNRKKCNFFLK